jgi:hypothetical protein
MGNAKCKMQTLVAAVCDRRKPEELPDGGALGGHRPPLQEVLIGKLFEKSSCMFWGSVF